MNLLESASLVNSAACLTLAVVTLIAFKDRGLKQQLRALRLLVGYVIMTLLTNLYLVSFSGAFIQQVSLVLSAVTVILLWVGVYKLWAKGE